MTQSKALATLAGFGIGPWAFGSVVVACLTYGYKGNTLSLGGDKIALKIDNVSAKVERETGLVLQSLQSGFETLKNSVDGLNSRVVSLEQKMEKQDVRIDSMTSLIVRNVSAVDYTIGHLKTLPQFKNISFNEETFQSHWKDCAEQRKEWNVEGFGKYFEVADATKRSSESSASVPHSTS